MINFGSQKLKILFVSLAVAVLFGLIHGSLFAFLINLPIAFIFSLCLILTGSVFTSIIMHAAGNIFFKIFSSLVANGVQDVEGVLEILPSATYALAGSLICLVFSALSFFWILRGVMLLAGKQEQISGN